MYSCRWSGQGGDVALLRSVSVNLAELRRAPATGGWGFPRSRDALTRGFGMLKFSPRLRDTLSRATAVAGHVTAWAGRAHARFRVDFELFEVRGLGRGGISEAA